MRQAKPKTLRRGGHEVYLDPPGRTGVGFKSYWNMRLNGHHIPLWPKTKAEGVEWARTILEAACAERRSV